jgi:phospholipid transport system substrate-binding protein
MPISESLIRPTRRAFCLGALAALAAAALPMTRALAAGEAERAQALVAQLSETLIALLRSGKSEAALITDFEALLARYGDMPVVAASVLGPPWRSASQAQKQAFVSAFQTYLSRKYGRQFTDYKNATIQIRRARDGGRSGVLVETVITRPGRDGFVVEWQVSERGGSPKVVNLIIEGVSMLTNERAEVGAMLEADGGNLDQLIARMRATA